MYMVLASCAHFLLCQASTSHNLIMFRQIFHQDIYEVQTLLAWYLNVLLWSYYRILSFDNVIIIHHITRAVVFGCICIKESITVDFNQICWYIWPSRLLYYRPMLFLFRICSVKVDCFRISGFQVSSPEQRDFFPSADAHNGFVVLDDITNIWFHG